MENGKGRVRMVDSGGARARAFGFTISEGRDFDLRRVAPGCVDPKFEMQAAGEVS
jgi:hypothetical protein